MDKFIQNQRKERGIALNRTYRYCVLNPKTGDIIRTITANQLKKDYGISRVSEKITSNRGKDYVLPDGNYLIENYETDERFKKIISTLHYDYYLSNRGYVLTRSKKNKERGRVKAFLRNNKYYFKDENNKLYDLANLVVISFFPNLPDNFKIKYEDGNTANCDLDNLLVIPPKKNVQYRHLSN